MNIREYHNMPGVRTIDLTMLPDERGFFMESLRLDWKDFMAEDQIVQVNTSFTYPGIIRAWHRHIRGQVDYFYVAQGALKICAYTNDNESIDIKEGLVEITASSRKPQIVRIPGHYWHGFKNVNNEPSLLIYFVNRLYDSQNPDEERRPWNDNTIINPSTKLPFDWNASPHK